MSEFNAIGSSTEVSRDDFTPEIEPQPTWCPGCGDFAVLKALKGALAELGKDPEEILIVTGIGCSSKTNSYFDSYGFHSIHGRPLPVARAAKLANPGLEVVAAGGDGDGYGIGGNHFTHTARENHDMTYIVFNNEVFGLTKGQSSPTSPKGHTSKTQKKGVAKDARQYVPYIDVQDSDDYDFDVADRQEAFRAMHETENALYEGKVLTGRYYVEDGRRSYQEEKQMRGEMPEEPLVERYFDDDYEWERSYDLLERHA